VSATNKAGTSGTSQPSAPVRAAGKPGTVAAPSASLVNTGGDGGQIRVSFTPLSAAQRNGSNVGEISYRYRLTSGAGSGAIPAGGGVVPAPNGQDTAVTIVAVSSRSSMNGDASAPSNSVNPYGLAFAPNVVGERTPGVGVKKVSWTWNTPNGNGRPVTGFQYSLDGGGWVSTNATSFSTGTGGYNEEHTLRVRAVSGGQPGRIGSDLSRSGNPPPPPPPNDKVAVNGGDINTCTEPEGGGSGYYGGTPKRCYGTTSPGGPGADYPWFSVSDGSVPVDRCGSPWGSGGGWYHISGPADSGKRLGGRWVKAATVHVTSGNVRC
jgi:large repetitive protein